MIVEPAPAKINLALHVRRRRDDGYHELETLFAFCRDGDVLRVAPAERDSFQLSGPEAALLHDTPDNLVVRARDRFREHIAPTPPLAVTLDKRLPVASGIGGGSADAAAMLRVCARLSNVALDDPRLISVATGLGADVPACLLGTTAIGGGVGERLEPIAGLGDAPVLLVNQRVEVATRAVFARWDGIDRGPMPAGDAFAIARQGHNDLTVPARAIAPVIGEVLDALDALGTARLVRMSGSGATCFAIFHDVAARASAAAAIRAAYPDWWCLETALA
jgi:4-diphosphocytidyl-2-C-methyl-D-erythritol kinase